jgi:hypothetical protein
METAPLWVGIDVAKDQLDVALGGVDESWSVPNDDTGIQALRRRHLMVARKVEAHPTQLRAVLRNPALPVRQVARLSATISGVLPRPSASPPRSQRR